jgi:hypothetical protein
MINKLTYIIPKGEIITSNNKIECLMIDGRLYKIHDKHKIDTNRYLIRVIDNESKTLFKNRMKLINKDKTNG